MPGRIMMQVAGTERPLSLGGTGRTSLILNSAETPWAGLPMELHAMGAVRAEPGEVGPVAQEHGILIIVEGRIDLVVREGRREIKTVGLPGSMTLLSGQRRRHVVNMTGSASALAVNVPKPWFGRMGLPELPSEFAVRNAFTPDQQLHALAQAMRFELQAGAPTGRLYADCLSVALLSYVFERLPLPSLRERARGTLSESQCRRLRAHIRERLGEDLRLADLAELVGISPRHFSLLFRRAFGVTPHRYLLGQRLAEGARLLAAGQTNIAQLALELGFCSQSHFSAAFRNEFHTTPRRYRLKSD